MHLHLTTTPACGGSTEFAELRRRLDEADGRRARPVSDPEKAKAEVSFFATSIALSLSVIVSLLVYVETSADPSLTIVVLAVVLGAAGALAGIAGLRSSNKLRRLAEEVATADVECRRLERDLDAARRTEGSPPPRRTGRIAWLRGRR